MHRVRRILAVLVAFAAITSCIARKTPAPAAFPFASTDRFLKEDEPESLFKGDSQVLSDGDIARILGLNLNLAGHHRLAVLRLSSTRQWWQDDSQAEAESMSAFLERLRSGGAFSEAQELPVLLVPEKRTVPFLREAGARFQADLLLVYNTSVRTFQKARTFGKDEVHAHCTVEAVVLHIPTGIVPFSARATEEIHASRKHDELDFSETVAKAVNSAEHNALMQIADDTVQFLKKHNGT